MAAFEVKQSPAMKKLPLRLLILVALALPTAAVAQRGDPVYVEDRLNQLQQAISLLTGQIEQLQYRNQQLQQQMEKMQADYEFRLEQVEKGGGRPGGGAGVRARLHRRLLPRRRRPRRPQVPPTRSTTTPSRSCRMATMPAPRRGFRTFVQRNPQHALAGNAQYWLGETYYARRDYQNAMTAFAEGYKAYKTSPKGPDNLLKLGVTLADAWPQARCLRDLRALRQDYPRATDLQKRRIDQERQKNGCG